MLDTVLAIGALGAIGVVGYFVLKSGKGVDEALDSFGDAVKSTIDAGSSLGDWIADGSYWLQKQLGIGSGAGSEEKGIIGKLNDSVDRDIASKKKNYVDRAKGISEAVGGAGEFLGNKFCHAQKLFNPSLRCG